MPAWISGALGGVSHLHACACAGTVCDVSDRPNTCSAAAWERGEVVVGSTDHALYIIDAAKGVKKRTLYSKTCGHSE